MTTHPSNDCDIVISHVLQPQDANPAGNVHGGVIMKLIDSAAGVVAARYARCNVVTVSIDRLDFHNPGFIGDLLTLRAKLNWVGNSSMEIGVEAQTEDLVTGEIRHTASAYLTFVALDENGRPKAVPPWVPRTTEEKHRFQTARQRRERRLLERKQETASHPCNQPPR